MMTKVTKNNDRMDDNMPVKYRNPITSLMLSRQNAWSVLETPLQSLADQKLAIRTLSLDPEFWLNDLDRLALWVAHRLQAAIERSPLDKQELDFLLLSADMLEKIEQPVARIELEQAMLACACRLQNKHEDELEGMICMALRFYVFLAGWPAFSEIAKFLVPDTPWIVMQTALQGLQNLFMPTPVPAGTINQDLRDRVRLLAENFSNPDILVCPEAMALCVEAVVAHILLEIHFSEPVSFALNRSSSSVIQDAVHKTLTEIKDKWVSCKVEPEAIKRLDVALTSFI